MKSKLIGLLGLMRRANKIEIGEVNTGTAARAHKAKMIVVASDASENAVKRAVGFSNTGRCAMVKLPLTKEETAAAVGLTGCSMAALTDSGFAGAFVNLLCEQDPDTYSKFRNMFPQKPEAVRKTKTPRKIN